MVLSDYAYFIIKAANAAKCAVTSIFVNMWYALASIYILA